MRKDLIDETGKKYGSLTVLSLTKDKDNRSAWLCQCDCGNTKIVRGPDLRKGRITHCSRSCPCKKNPKFIDQTGKQYGFLKILYKAPYKSQSQKTLWHCKCICGKECDVIGEDLRRGNTKSCGCKTKELNSQKHTLNLKGQTFGYLIPIQIVGKNKQGMVWRCKCTCGCDRNDVKVSARHLISGNSKSCGRWKRSYNEVKIEQILKDNNISFLPEYTFDDLYNKEKTTKLRFDFVILNKQNKVISCIEFDGKQHFEPNDFFGGEEGFNRLKQNDNRKNIYCKENNIPLLRIRFDENIEDKINIFLKEFKIINYDS